MSTPATTTIDAESAHGIYGSASNIISGLRQNYAAWPEAVLQVLAAAVAIELLDTAVPGDLENKTAAFNMLRAEIMLIHHGLRKAIAPPQENPSDAKQLSN